jgi:protein involved in polysaccharide export with SLBB domain
MNKKHLVIFLYMSFLIGQSSSIDFQSLSNQEQDLLKSQIQDSSSLNSSDNQDSIKIDEIEIKNIAPLSESIVEQSYFGYEYFEKDINFFDNTPTPKDFKLGPGDEIILSLWGEKNSREKLTINKDGLIYFQDIGFINISNKTLDEAEKILTAELSQVYSTLDDKNSTELMIELGKLKSINVFFSGMVNSPGINLIHPFSDIFTALNQVGIKASGSLREIELIRNGELLSKFDFYAFFMRGDDIFSDIKILDSDVIHVPPVKKRVEIKGQVINPNFYELLDSESLANLIDFSGGLTAEASNSAILTSIAPVDGRDSDENATSRQLISLYNSSYETINNGGVLNILQISDNDIDLNIFGRVKNPGAYPAFKVEYSGDKKIQRPISLKELLDVAGGFNDPIYRKSIYDEIKVLRLDEDSFYAKEINVNFKDSADFILELNDQIFVYQNNNFYRSQKYTIKGEVLKAGTFPLTKGLTIGDAINLAGGISETGSLESISVIKELKRFDENGIEIDEEEVVGNITLDFELSDKNVITILPKTNVVKIDGNVYNPGLINIDKNYISMTRAIELAGGYKPYSKKKSTYVIRANGKIDKAKIFRGRAKLIYPGDTVFVPLNPNPQDFDISLFISELSSTLANLAAILILIDNTND